MFPNGEVERFVLYMLEDHKVRFSEVYFCPILTTSFDSLILRANIVLLTMNPVFRDHLVAHANIANAACVMTAS